MSPGAGPPPSATNGFQGLRRAGIAAWSVLGVLALIAVASWLLYQIRDVLPPLGLALAIIFLLNPLVSRLQERGVPRTWGTLAIYLLFLVGITLVGLVLIPPIVRQIRELVMAFEFSDPQDFQNRVSAAVEGLADRVGLSVELDPAAVAQQFERLQGEIFSGIGQITRFTLEALHLVLVFVLAPIFALYLLIDLPRLQASFVDHLPPGRREEWLLVLDRCGQAIGSFFRGQLMVAVVVGIMSSILLWIVRIPFWLAIGMLAGFFNLIPLVGPFVGGALAVIVGAIDGGLPKALLGALAMLAVQQVDNHFISPNVMGRAVQLRPITVMVALLAGGTLAGLWGMLLAVPGTAVAKIVLMHLYNTRVLGRPSPYDQPVDPKTGEPAKPPVPSAEPAPAESPKATVETGAGRREPK